MSNYEIGYGKPPKQFYFKLGNRANPQGRPRRTAPATAELINNVLDGISQYTEGGRSKKASRFQLAVKKHVNQALKGHLKSAEILLKLLIHLEGYGEAGAQKIIMRDWQPDHPGQTAEQKTSLLAVRGETDATQWWKPSDVNSSKDQ
jgi:hypothetical protein